MLAGKRTPWASPVRMRATITIGTEKAMKGRMMHRTPVRTEPTAITI